MNRVSIKKLAEELTWIWPGREPDDLTWAAYVYLRNRLGKPIGDGRHRVVFHDKRTQTVLKLPKCRLGVSANRRELRNEIGLPKNALPKMRRDEQLSVTCGVMILRMEYVNERPLLRQLPDWYDRVDCSQVGVTLDGRIVAYDLAE